MKDSLIIKYTALYEKYRTAASERGFTFEFTSDNVYLKRISWRTALSDSPEKLLVTLIFKLRCLGYTIYRDHSMSTTIDSMIDKDPRYP